MLGEQIRKARLKADLTQEELARRAGLSRNYVSLLEQDAKSPTIKMLLRICKALGVKASRIIARIEND